MKPRSLWEAARERSLQALRSGALEPIPTRCERLEDAGVAFTARVRTGEGAKERATASDRRTGRNPFLPYDEELLVGPIGATHVALLNKFPVLEPHLLVVTRVFEEQESLLTPEDFEALFHVLDEVDGLGFYNAGAVAGASQPHKHLQVVASPAAGWPVERLLPPASAETTRSSGLPLQHALAPSPFARAARGPASETLYLEMLRAVGQPSDPRAYNLLATRRWLLLIPRSRASLAGIPVNALGFAGVFLVRDEHELATLRRMGPLKLLNGVARSGG